MHRSQPHALCSEPGCGGAARAPQHCLDSRLHIAARKPDRRLQIPSPGQDDQSRSCTATLTWRRIGCWLWPPLALLAMMLPAGASATAVNSNPHGLRPADLAVVVNTADPLSVAIGTYYVAKRHIPKANVIRIHFDHERDDIPPEE